MLNILEYKKNRQRALKIFIPQPYQARNLEYYMTINSMAETGLLVLRELNIAVAYPGSLFGEGVQQIQLRTEDREWGSGGGSLLLPSQGFWRQL